MARRAVTSIGKRRSAARIPKKSAIEEMFFFHVKAAGLINGGFVRELMFHPKRRWKFDFAWMTERIAVEVEGGVFSGGRHTRGAGFTADCEKYNEAALLGWAVLRVTGNQVKSGDALRLIERALK